eukprot:1562259-Alexandrium_andersonii.AAC.1
MPWMTCLATARWLCEAQPEPCWSLPVPGRAAQGGQGARARRPDAPFHVSCGRDDRDPPTLGGGDR